MSIPRVRAWKWPCRSRQEAARSSCRFVSYFRSRSFPPVYFVTAPLTLSRPSTSAASGSCNVELADRRGGIALAATTMQVVHGNIQINIAAGRFEAQHQRFRIHAIGQAFFVRMNFRRKHLKAKALIVE